MVWWLIIGVIITLILGGLSIALIYTILSMLQLAVTLIAGVFTFFYLWGILKKLNIDEYISVGLSFLITSAIMVWIYQSWGYIIALVMLLGVVWVFLKIFGIDPFKIIREAIKK
jgi:hypothetical protein